VSIGLLVERYNHHTSYRIVLTQENEESEEEMFELTDDKNNDDEGIQSRSTLELDPCLTRLTRTLCRPCVPLLDA
jgi:hypothetical protein